MSLSTLIHEQVRAGRGRAFLVGGGEALEGIVCLSDAKKVLSVEWPRTRVGAVMTPRDRLQTAHPGDNLDRVLSRMSVRGCAQVPIVEGGRVVGLISRSDIIEFFKTKSEIEV